MTTAITSASALFASTNAQKEAKRTDLGQDAFLRLMTEQLKHQDPLKPLDNKEFLGQLAQFSTVKGIENLQKTFSGVVDALGSDQNLKAAELIGHMALVPADHFKLEATGGMDGAVFATGPGKVLVDINDKNGQLVGHVEVAAANAGDISYHWDGKDASGAALPPGDYTIKATYNDGTTSVAAMPMVSARIDSVSLTSSGIAVNLAGLGLITFSSIRRLS